MTSSQDPQDQQKIHELLADYVLGEVSPQQAEKVRAMLTKQPQLQRELDQLQETLALLPLALPVSTPPLFLKEQIIQRCQNQKKVKTRLKFSINIGKKSNLITLMSIMFSLAIATILGFHNYRLQQRIALLESQVQQANNSLFNQSGRMVNLQGTSKAPLAQGAVVVMPEKKQVIMTLQNLPALPPDKIYNLWAVNNGKKADCGQFQTDAQGHILKEMPLEEVMMNSTQLLVTIEPMNPKTQSQGPTVMVGQI